MCREPRLAASGLQQVQNTVKSRTISGGLERSDTENEKRPRCSRGLFHFTESSCRTYFFFLALAFFLPPDFLAAFFLPPDFFLAAFLAAFFLAGFFFAAGFFLAAFFAAG